METLRGDELVDLLNCASTSRVVTWEVRHSTHVGRATCPGTNHLLEDGQRNRLQLLLLLIKLLLLRSWIGFNPRRGFVDCF